MQTKNPQNSTNSKKINRENFAYSNANTLVKTKVFGVEVTNETEENILEYIIKIIKKSSENIYIVTPNPEMIMFARHHNDFRRVLNDANLALCDGVGLFVGAQLMGKSLKERIIGTNFVEKVCEKAVDWPITIGFLGGGPRVAERASECLSARYRGLKVTFAGSDPKDLLALPASEMPTILFVALGVPKQEFWMAEYSKKLSIRIMMGVGGAFDQIINSSLRPPAWVHSLGLGWLYRLIRQPWRIKRQLVLIPFMLLVIKEKLFSASQ